MDKFIRAIVDCTLYGILMVMNTGEILLIKYICGEHLFLFYIFTIAIILTNIDMGIATIKDKIDAKF